MENEKVVVGGTVFELLFAEILPRLSVEQYNTLKEDMVQNGIHIPVITDEDKGVIDGSHRMRIASELNLKSVPIIVMHGLNDNDKKNLAIKLNTQRRQMTVQERLELAISLRRDGLSLRNIASVLNISHETVRSHLATVKDLTVEMPEKIKGLDGKIRDATVKPKQQPCTIAKNVAEANKILRFARR